MAENFFLDIIEFSWLFWTFIFLYKFKNQFVSWNQEILLAFCWTLNCIYGWLWRELSWFISQILHLFFLWYSATYICLHIMFCSFRAWQLACSLTLDESWRKNVSATLLTWRSGYMTNLHMQLISIHSSILSQLHIWLPT